MTYSDNSSLNPDTNENPNGTAIVYNRKALIAKVQSAIAELCAVYPCYEIRQYILSHHGSRRYRRYAWGDKIGDFMKMSPENQKKVLFILYFLAIELKYKSAY